ncbi:hypothetical protein ACX8XP_12410 [Calditrichota bacterium LG25]
MMRMFRFILILLFSFWQIALAQVEPQQKASVRLKIAYSFYAMNDMKAFNKELLRQYQYTVPDMAITENFPAFFGYTIEVFNPFSRMPFGYFVSYNSTGSRITYSDYSGAVYYDMLVKRLWLGIFKEKTVKHGFYISLYAGVMANYLVINQKLIVWQERVKSRSKYWGMGLAIAPNIGYRIKFNGFSLGIYLGFELDYAAIDLKNTENPNLRLHFKGAYLNPDWSGLRFGISVGY